MPNPIATWTIDVEIPKRKRDPATGFSVADGTLRAEVTLTVSLDALARMLGKKAITSKGKKAQLCHGKIQVIAKNVMHRPYTG